MLCSSAANWRRSHALPSQLPPVTIPKPGSETPPDAPTVQGLPPMIDGAKISGVFRSVVVLVELLPNELPLAAVLVAGDDPLDVRPDVLLDPPVDPLDVSLLMITSLVELLRPLLAAAPERLLLLLLPLAAELLDEAPLPIGLP
jgi:hypothetical protein